MKVKNIAQVGARKIVSIGTHEFTESEISDVLKLGFEIFIYSYEHGGYEGSGFAAWKKGRKYFYHQLGHCSCNGPTDQIEQSAKVGITFKQLREIANKNYQTHGKEVVANFAKIK